MYGDTFQTDAAEVHTYLINFIAGKTTAESKVLPTLDQHNGRLDFIALKEHYEAIAKKAGLRLWQSWQTSRLTHLRSKVRIPPPENFLINLSNE